MKPRRVGLVAALTAMTVLAVACGEPEFEYPNDSVEGVYFKVPRSWTVFDQTDEYFEGRVGAATGAEPVRLWFLDSNDPATIDNVAVLDGDQPVGRAQILQVSSSISEGVSISTARAAGFEFDPASPPADLEDTWEVALDAPMRTEDGISGAVAIFNHRETVSDEWLTQGREVFVDPTRQRVYILDIYCTAECFDLNRDEIFDILDSWRIDL
jgi:hypothetical protein